MTLIIITITGYSLEGRWIRTFEVCEEKYLKTTLTHLKSLWATENLYICKIVKKWKRSKKQIQEYERIRHSHKLEEEKKAKIRSRLK